MDHLFNIYLGVKIWIPSLALAYKKLIICVILSPKGKLACPRLFEVKNMQPKIKKLQQLRVVLFCSLCSELNIIEGQHCPCATHNK